MVNNTAKYPSNLLNKKSSFVKVPYNVSFCSYIAVWFWGGFCWGISKRHLYLVIESEFKNCHIALPSCHIYGA